MALKERAVAARASAWAKTVEKLRSRQMALKERAVPVRTADREFDRVWNGQCPDEVAPKPVASVPGLRKMVALLESSPKEVLSAIRKTVMAHQKRSPIAGLLNHSVRNSNALACDWL